MNKLFSFFRNWFNLATDLNYFISFIKEEKQRIIKYFFGAVITTSLICGLFACFNLYRIVKPLFDSFKEEVPDFVIKDNLLVLDNKEKEIFTFKKDGYEILIDKNLDVNGDLLEKKDYFIILGKNGLVIQNDPQKNIFLYKDVLGDNNQELIIKKENWQKMFYATMFLFLLILPVGLLIVLFVISFILVIITASFLMIWLKIKKIYNPVREAFRISLIPIIPALIYGTLTFILGMGVQIGFMLAYFIFFFILFTSLKVDKIEMIV